MQKPAVTYAAGFCITPGPCFGTIGLVMRAVGDSILARKQGGALLREKRMINGSGKQQWPRHLLIIGVILAALYGNSYQQFRHFDPTDPRGASDGLDYMKMSHGDWEVKATRRYRFIVPTLASWLQPAIGKVIKDPMNRDILSFYLVNLVFMAGAAWLFYLLLRAYEFPWAVALIGVLFFCFSRITVLSTGTPLVDSVYYLAIVFTLLCIYTRRWNELALAMPLLVLSKETIVPFLVLALVAGKGARIKLSAGLAVGFGLTAWTRYLIKAQVPPDTEYPGSFVEVVTSHVETMHMSLLRLISPTGWHDIQNGFSFVLALAVIGGWIQWKLAPSERRGMPPLFLLVIPLAFFYALLSSNLGRMFFAASFVIIPYALVALERVMGSFEEKPVREVEFE